MKPKRVPVYLQNAKKRFLKGLWYSAPIDAVLAGKRSLEDWVDIVAQEHELELERAREARKFGLEARVSQLKSNVV